MVVGEGGEQMNWRHVVVSLVGFVAFLAVLELFDTGLFEQSDPESSRPPPSLGGRAARDVTCRETADLDVSYALALKVTEELALPNAVDHERAVATAERAIWDRCFDAASDTHHPVDSDFKHSLTAKLTRRR